MCLWFCLNVSNVLVLSCPFLVVAVRDTCSNENEELVKMFTSLVQLSKFSLKNRFIYPLPLEFLPRKANRGHCSS